MRGRLRAGVGGRSSGVGRRLAGVGAEAGRLARPRIARRRALAIGCGASWVGSWITGSLRGITAISWGLRGITGKRGGLRGISARIAGGRISTWERSGGWRRISACRGHHLAILSGIHSRIVTQI
jgi:hypothetical protein